MSCNVPEMLSRTEKGRLRYGANRQAGHETVRTRKIL